MAESEIPFSIGIEVFAKLQKLEDGLKEAEKSIERGAKRIAAKSAMMGTEAGRAGRDAFLKEIKKIHEEVKVELEKVERAFLLKLYKINAARAQAKEDQQTLHGLRPDSPATLDPMGGGGGSKSAETAGKVFASKYVDGMKSKMKALLGTAAAIGLADVLLKGLVKGIKDKETTIAHALGNALEGVMRSIPAVGPLGDLFAMAFDPLFGGAMASEEEQKESRAASQENMQRNARLARREQMLAQRQATADKFVANTGNRMAGIRRERDISHKSENINRAKDKFSGTEFKSQDEIMAGASELFRQQQAIYDKQKEAAKIALDLEKDRIRASDSMLNREKAAAIALAQEEHHTTVDNIRRAHQQEEKNLDKLEQAKQDALRERMALEESQAIAIRQSFTDAQAGMQSMREAAQLSASRQTSTFSTAGGSFTAAAVAQVNELKILRAAVEKFPVLLLQIAANTAMGGVSLR